MLKKSLCFMLTLLLLAGCGKPAAPKPTENQQTGSSQPAQGEQTLTAAIFGGSWGEAIKKHIVEPFQAKHNVKINLVEGTSTVTLSKLKQEKSSPTIDIALMDSGISELAFQEGLVDTIDRSALTNANHVMPEGFQSKDDQTFGVALGYWGLGLAYNPEKIKNPPTSWNDLWREEYQDVVTIPTPATTGGLPFLMKIAELNGGSSENVDAGFEKIKQLKVVAYFNGSGAASNLYQSGEAWVGAHYGGPVWSLKDQGVPIEFVVPKEGVLGAGSFWHIVKGSKNKELAIKFLDETLGKNAQQGIAESLYLAPVNKEVTLSEKAAERMPFGKNGSIRDLTFPDYNLINKHREEWNERWNKEIGKQ
jgi:putative spermidine/putrescine transport system substrate-binding protein